MAPTKRIGYIGLIAASILIPGWGCSSEPAKAPPGAPADIPDVGVDALPEATVQPTGSTPPPKPATQGSAK